ncbi:MAG: HesB/IscA family protein [Fidelibacterota bacterium]
MRGNEVKREPSSDLEAFNQMTITVTPAAVKRFRAAMVSEGKENYALRFGVDSGGCSGLNYTMSFSDQAGPDDKIMWSNGLQIFCDLKSWLVLKGCTIDYSDDLLNGGFKIINPNADKTCGCGTSFST